MTSTFLISSVHLLVAIVQLILAGITIISNPKARGNRAISVLLTLFALTSMSLGFMLNSLTISSSLPWLYINGISTFALGASTFFTALIIISPKNSSRLLVAVPLYILILFPTLATLLDATSLSTQIFGSNILFSVEELLQYSGGFLSLTEVYTGPAALIFRVLLIIFFAISLLYTLIIAIKERRENPIDSRYAFILALAGFIGVLSNSILQEILPITVPILFTNLAYTIAFTFIGLQKSDDQLNITGLQNMVSNFPMVNKLLIATAGVVIPVVLIINVVALGFLQSTITEIVGSNLVELAKTESQYIDNAFTTQIGFLDNIGKDSITIAILTTRANSFAGKSQDEIAAQKIEAERIWQAGDNDDLFIKNILSPSRNEHLVNYINLAPLNMEMLIIDEQGGLVTTTEMTETYNFSGTDWWQFVITNGKPFVGNPEQVTGSDDKFVNIAIPLKIDPTDDSINGVLVTRFVINRITTHLEELAASSSKTTDVYAANGDILYDSNPDFNTNALVDPAGLHIHTAEQDWQIVRHEGIDSIIAWSNSLIVNEESPVNWTIISHAQVNTALQSISAARTGAIFLAILTVAGSISFTVMISRFIVQPLSDLTASTEQVLEGDFSATSDVSGDDEIGRLAETFNRMTTELNRTVNNLEETVKERTEELEKRALQMETSSLVAREASGILDVQELLNRTTQLISERFDFYHTGIFLVDEVGEYAVLQAANSPGGTRMLARGHKLQIGKVGVVGYAAGSAEPRLAQDVGADVIYYDNPVMPDTRSELALPLTVREKVIGVLDVQSSESNAFSRDDIEVLQLLADQIALAIENAKLIQSSQKSLEEVEYLYGQQAVKAWQDQISNKEISYQFDPIGLNIQNSEQREINP
ncbi:MAG: GAF domain-containing protein [Chloroflexota bacterium]